MPNNGDTERFIRTAFEQGLNKDQVKQALILRKQKFATKALTNSEEDDSWFDFMPTWWKVGYNNSIEGMGRQIATGKAPFKIPEDYDQGVLADIASTVASFITPTDVLIFTAGTLAGGVGGAPATLAARAGARGTLQLLVKAGVKSSVAKKIATAGALKAVEQNIARATGQGVTLGFYSGIGGTLGHKIESGEWSPMAGVKGAAEGFALGATAGLAGGLAGGATAKFGKLAQVPAEFGAEAGAFAVTGAAMEGRLANADDFIQSAGVILGMRGAKLPIKGIQKLKKFKTEPKYVRRDGKTTYKILQVRTKPDGKKILLRENLKTGKQSWIEKKKFEDGHRKLTLKDVPAIVKKTIKVPDFEMTKHSAPPKKPQRKSLLGKAHQLQRLNSDIVKRRKGSTDKEKWARFKKDKFGKESLSEFSNEEIVQFMQTVEKQAGEKFKQAPIPIKQKIEEAHWNEVRADVFVDINTESTFEVNLLNRLRTKMNKIKSGVKKGIIRQFHPTEESVSILNDPLSWRLTRDIAIIAKNIRRIADERIVENFIKPLKEQTDGRISRISDFELKNHELLERMAVFYDTGKAKGASDGRFTATDVMKAAKAYELFDIQGQHAVRAARLFSSFRSGSKSTRPKGIPESDLKKVNAKNDKEFYIKMEEKFRDLLDRYPIDRAIGKFMEEMKGYKFGVRKKYTPIEWQTDIARWVEKTLRGERVKLPTGRYHIREGEGVRDPKRMFSWLKNGYYRDIAMLRLDFRVEDLGKRLKYIDPSNIKRITPFIRSLYNAPQDRIPFLSTTAGLGYTAWIMSLWPTVRNLTQNFARMAWFPKTTVMRNVKWAMQNLDNKKYFSAEDKQFFTRMVSEMTGVADSHLLMYTYFRNAPKSIRKYERAFKFVGRHYPWSDTMNRKILFAWLKPLYGEVTKYMNHEGVYADRSKAYETLSRRMRLGQMNDVVQVFLRGELDKPLGVQGGPKTNKDKINRFMQEYIRQMETDVHHQYLRHERPLWMQNKAMKPFAGLLTYANSTWSKVIRESKVLTEPGRTVAERAQAGEIIVNQFADIFARMALRAARYGTSIWALKSLTNKEDENAYRAIKAKDAYDTMSWVIPSLFANNLVEKITGRKATYGVGELFFRLPLEISTAAQFNDTVGKPLYNLMKDVEDAASWKQLFIGVERAGTNILPFLDAMVTFMSINYDMLRGSLFEDFIPAVVRDELTPERMRLLKIKFREKSRDRFNYVSSKEFDGMEKLIYNVQRFVVRGERRVGELRDRASEPYIHGIVLEDMASIVFKDDPETAEKLRLMADEYFEEYEQARKYVPQRAIKTQQGAPYRPGRQKVLEEIERLRK